MEAITSPVPAVAVAREDLDGNYGQLGITRGNYVALHADDPVKASEFAVAHMGFALVHVDDDDRHYLAGHGLDPYSLVYTPAGTGPVDHISFVVDGFAKLREAETWLSHAGVTYERVEESPLWRHQSALRVATPTGATIELTPGVPIDIPMAELVQAPQAVPAPLAFDHAILRAADVDGMLTYMSEVLGLRESGRIVAPDGIPVLSFYRAKTLFHCFGVARSPADGLHHYEFTLKNDRAVIAAFEQMNADPAVEIVWGPVRHGCGQNVAFYFRDGIGNLVEYSAEEELILNEEAYEVCHWPVQNPRSEDEWGSHVPDGMK